jgi:hypothetical protein
MEDMNIPKLTIRGQTAEEEFRYLTDHVLNQLPFYEKYGYQVSLPKFEEFKHPIPPGIKKKAFGDFLRKEYREKFYSNGIETLNQDENTIKDVFPIFLKLYKAWGFEMFPTYTVKLTKYGPGGSYNPNTGEITMLTTVDGRFKQLNPTNTIIHESVHMGIENLIVKKYKLTHTEKERLVDLICMNLFQGNLKDYRIQSIGDSKIDPFISKETDIYNLPAQISMFIRDNPR